MLKKITQCWFVWLLLALFALYTWLVPDKGLIGPIELPDDDAFLSDEGVQWWYWTGHLESEEGKQFGFEVVFFVFDGYLILLEQLVQAAITDIDANQFHYGEHVEFNNLPNKLDGRFKLSSGKADMVTAEGGGGHDRLHSEVDGYVLDLDLAASKAPVLHYAGGPHPYRFNGYTYYYSREAMQARGTLSYGGKTYKVTGTSWFDRQYGELMQAITQGWQWFSIDLDDDTQIMLYDFNGTQNDVENFASVTNAKGHTRVYDQHDFTVTQLGEWTSPDTGCTYPSGWRVDIAGRKPLIIEPQVKNQELHAKHHFWASPVYWEGANSVSDGAGQGIGKAYVELNGFCPDHMIEKK